MGVNQTSERLTVHHRGTHTHHTHTRAHVHTHTHIQIAKDCAAKTPQPAKLKEFKEYMASEGNKRADIAALREEVEAMALGFPMPGLAFPCQACELPCELAGWPCARRWRPGAGLCHARPMSCLGEKWRPCAGLLPGL
eukprot:scaffold6059_cov22-Tisochrysis_lutea.AAC.2